MLSGEQIGQLMDRIREQFAMAQDAEITMEVNPGTASAEKLRNFYTAGINRLSIGMQSAQAEELKIWAGSMILKVSARCTGRPWRQDLRISMWIS